MRTTTSFILVLVTACRASTTSIRSETRAEDSRPDCSADFHLLRADLEVDAGECIAEANNSATTLRVGFSGVKRVSTSSAGYVEGDESSEALRYLRSRFGEHAIEEMRLAGPIFWSGLIIEIPMEELAECDQAIVLPRRALLARIAYYARDRGPMGARFEKTIPAMAFCYSSRGRQIWIGAWSEGTILASFTRASEEEEGGDSSDHDRARFMSRSAWPIQCRSRRRTQDLGDVADLIAACNGRPKYRSPNR